MLEDENVVCPALQNSKRGTYEPPNSVSVHCVIIALTCALFSQLACAFPTEKNDQFEARSNKAFSKRVGWQIESMAVVVDCFLPTLTKQDPNSQYFDLNKNKELCAGVASKTIERLKITPNIRGVSPYVSSTSIGAQTGQNLAIAQLSPDAGQTTTGTIELPIVGEAHTPVSTVPYAETAADIVKLIDFYDVGNFVRKESQISVAKKLVGHKVSLPTNASEERTMLILVGGQFLDKELSRGLNAAEGLKTLALGGLSYAATGGSYVYLRNRNYSDRMIAQMVLIDGSGHIIHYKVCESKHPDNAERAAKYFAKSCLLRF